MSETLKILFLDDSLERCRVVKQNLIGTSLTIVHTADECLEAMRSGEFDIIMLDHDLSYETILNNHPDDKDGSYVVRHLLNENLQPAATYIVHSLNTDKARGMVGDIIRSGRECLGHVPFAWQFVSVKNGLLTIDTNIKPDYSKE